MVQQQGRLRIDMAGLGERRRRILAVRQSSASSSVWGGGFSSRQRLEGSTAIPAVETSLAHAFGLSLLTHCRYACALEVLGFLRGGENE